MKYLSKSQTVEEFNDNLKDGLEHGIVLKTEEELKLMAELYSNLTYYFTFFITADELRHYGKKEV